MVRRLVTEELCTVVYNFHNESRIIVGPSRNTLEALDDDDPRKAILSLEEFIRTRPPLPSLAVASSEDMSSLSVSSRVTGDGDSQSTRTCGNTQFGLHEGRGP